MRTLSLSLLGLMLCVAGAAGAFAQVTAKADTNPVSMSMQATWTEAKSNLQRSAELVPEDTLTFRPVDTVRTFGEIVAHAAAANYMFCALSKGEKAPHDEAEIMKLAASKAGLTKAVTESIAYCDAVFGALTDAKAGELIPAWGGRTLPRAAVLLLATSHVDLHYGNLVTYFRINGIVPPSSRGGS